MKFIDIWTKPFGRYQIKTYFSGIIIVIKCGGPLTWVKRKEINTILCTLIYIGTHRGIFYGADACSGLADVLHLSYYSNLNIHTTYLCTYN